MRFPVRNFFPFLNTVLVCFFVSVSRSESGRLERIQQHQRQTTLLHLNQASWIIRCCSGCLSGVRGVLFASLAFCAVRAASCASCPCLPRSRPLLCLCCFHNRVCRPCVCVCASHLPLGLFMHRNFSSPSFCRVHLSYRSLWKA